MVSLSAGLKASYKLASERVPRRAYSCKLPAVPSTSWQLRAPGNVMGETQLVRRFTIANR